MTRLHLAGALALLPAAALAQTVEVGTAEGWEIVAAPGTAETVGSFLGPTWTQCFPGSDANGAACATSGPNVFFYDESVDGGLNEGYVAPSAATDRLGPGVGVFVYLFADDDADGAAEGFPKTLPLSGDEPALPFTWGDPATADAPLTYTDDGDGGGDLGDDTADDGWNLLGNPVRGPFSWNATWDNAAVRVGPTAQAYHRPSNAYTTFDAENNVRGGAGDAFSADGVLGAGAGFYVRATGEAPRLTAPSQGDPPPPPGRRAGPSPYLALHLAEVGGPRRAGAVLILADGATFGADPADAPALLPPGAPYLAAGLVTEPDGRPYASAVVPPDEGPTVAELALGVSGIATAALTWTDALPEGWRATVLDRAEGIETPMGPGGAVELDLRDASPGLEAGRYAVRIEGPAPVGAGEGPPAVALSAPYPNPTAGRASARVELAEAGPLRAVLLDVLGREVAVVYDGPAPSGLTALPVDAVALAPGPYVLHVTGPGLVSRRVLTVAR